MGGIPENWRDVAFHQLRADGGLLVSAKRESGRVRFIRLLSKTGMKHIISVGDSAWQSALRVDPPLTPIQSLGGGEWEVVLLAGTHVLLYPADGAVPDFTIAPVAGNASEH